MWPSHVYSALGALVFAATRVGGRACPHACVIVCACRKGMCGTRLCLWSEGGIDTLRRELLGYPEVPRGHLQHPPTRWRMWHEFGQKLLQAHMVVARTSGKGNVNDNRCGACCLRAGAVCSMLRAHVLRRFLARLRRQAVFSIHASIRAMPIGMLGYLLSRRDGWLPR